MKRTLLKSAVSLLLVGSAVIARAQFIKQVDPQFSVNSPASITGVKTITNSRTSNWGRAIDSLWLNVPVVKVHDPISDSLGCGVLNNGQSPYPTLRGGKFALVFRGDCEFGTKAKKAQDSGAIGVIIVNNVAGAPVGMGDGADGASVTIPVLMVSQADGDAMNNALRAGQAVTISLTGWGLGYNNDIAISKSSLSMPHACAIPISQFNATTTPAVYRTYTSGMPLNLGTANQTNIKLVNTVTFTPSTGPTISLYKDSISESSITTVDSGKQLYSRNVNYNLNPTTTGRYDFTYTVTGNLPENQPGNNSASTSLYVTDSVFSKGRYDIATGKPIVSGGYRFAGSLAGNAMTWGPLYYNVKGGYNASKVSFAISNGDGKPTLENEAPTYVYLYRWKDLNNDNNITGNEMSLKGIGQKSYTISDSSFQIQTVSLRVPSLNTPVVTEDSAWYWVGVECGVNRLQFYPYMGCDFESNYYSRSYAAKHSSSPVVEYWAPQLRGSGAPAPGSAGTLPITATFFMLPFITATNVIDSVGGFGNYGSSQKGLVPVAALHLSKNPAKVSVPAISNFVDVSLFPNPSTTTLSLNLVLNHASNKVYFSIIDAVGKNMLRTYADNVQAKEFTFNVGSYPAGNYYLIVSTNDEVTAKPFTVVAH